MVEIKRHTGEVIRSSENLRALREHGQEFPYVVLWAEGKTLHVRFGTGENPDTCVTEFDNPDVLERWIASRVYCTRGSLRGQCIRRATFERMEAARSRLGD